MRTYTIETRGFDARITITTYPMRTNAHGIAFDEHADVVAETETRGYVGYCDRCIAYDIAGAMLATRRQIEYDDINAALDAVGLACDCDD